MPSRPRLLPGPLRSRLVHECDQELAVAIRRSRDPGAVVDAIVEGLVHFFKRESLSVRLLGDLDELASALTERLERHHGMRGLGPPGATLRFDGAWLLAQIDALAGLRWEGHEPAPAETATTTAATDPRAAHGGPSAPDPRVSAASPEDFRPYRPSERFAEGDLVRHAKFGEGRVARVIDASKIEVLFADGPRTLAHRAGG